MVIFLSDDHTWRDSSVYGSADCPTPNMQRLAEQGITFDQAFVVSPSCAPSRAALLTGFYPARNGAEPNHSRPHAGLKKLPAYLQELGYEVVSFGKVGHYRQTPEYGFDLAKHFNYHEDVAIAEAIKWLETRQDDRPLCLFVGSNWPHVPWPTEHDFKDDQLSIPPNHVDNATTRKWRARYLAAIQKMDEELGKVYDTAQRVLGDNLFFMHTSDHGAQWPFGKWNLYEDGIHTPMLVSWPSKIVPASRTQAMVSWIDILPTLVDVAGGAPPKDIDGRSFLRVLRGETSEHRSEIFATHSGDGNFNVFPSRAVRDKFGWKYIRNLRPDLRVTTHVTWNRPDSQYWDSWLDTAYVSSDARSLVKRFLTRPSEELYNQTDDPFDLKNVANNAAHSQKQLTLSRILDAWLAQTDDALAIFGEELQRPKAKQPNIVMVFIDDMGFADLSCFGGNQTQTQNIDRLAKEGLRFSQFYVNSPICSPSRTALTTGQYPQRWKISSYLSNRKANRNRGVAQWLDPAAPCLPRELRKNGYYTGHFGKWHMGGQRDVGNAPLIFRYGFDRSLTNFEGLGPRILGYKNIFDGGQAPLHDLGSDKLGKGPIFYANRSEITEKFVDQALKHIRHSQANNQPFYINLWPDDVHSPFFPPAVLRSNTDESKRALYYAVLDEMDVQLGRLFDHIRNDDQLRSNTVIMLCSDNGHEPGAGSAGELRGCKAILYEGGIRSPLIVWGPGFVADNRVGTVNDESVFSAIDLNRSLYTLTETAVPAGSQLDGEDLLETILGKTTNSREQPLFFRRPPDRGGYNSGNSKKMIPVADAPDLAIRRGKWKLLLNYDQSQIELYDLQVDSGEQNNLADAHPGIVQELSNALFSWNATLPKDAGDPNFQKLQLESN